MSTKCKHCDADAYPITVEDVANDITALLKTIYRPYALVSVKKQLEYVAALCAGSCLACAEEKHEAA